MLHFLEGSNLFDQHSNKKAIKNILAVLMIKVIYADTKITKKEQNAVLNFYKNEFGLNKEETIKIFNEVGHYETSFNEALLELQAILSGDSMAKAKALQHLNSIIICDGCTEEEYEIFEDIKSYLI